MFVSLSLPASLPLSEYIIVRPVSHGTIHCPPAVTAKVAKSMMKVGVVCGIIGYGVIHAGVGLPAGAMKELHIDSAAKTIEEKTKGILDINNDGVINSDDILAGKDKLSQFISTHIPLSGGFAAGFAAGL